MFAITSKWNVRIEPAINPAYRGDGLGPLPAGAFRVPAAVPEPHRSHAGSPPEPRRAEATGAAGGPAFEARSTGHAQDVAGQAGRKC